MSERQSVLYFPYSTLFSRVKGHKGSPVLPRLLPSIVMGSLLRRAHFESLRAAEAKNSATINQLYRSRSCITENIALGAWSGENKALGCASCFIGSRPHPLAIFPVMHSHGTLTSMYCWNSILQILCHVLLYWCHFLVHQSHVMRFQLWFEEMSLIRFCTCVFVYICAVDVYTLHDVMECWHCVQVHDYSAVSSSYIINI